MNPDLTYALTMTTSDPDDLVTRARHLFDDPEATVAQAIGFLHEMADEIERLRAKLEAIDLVLGFKVEDQAISLFDIGIGIGEKNDEIERLQHELELTQLHRCSGWRAEVKAAAEPKLPCPVCDGSGWCPNTPTSTGGDE